MIWVLPALGRKSGQCRLRKPPDSSHTHHLYSGKGMPSFPKSPFGLVSEKLRCSCSLPLSSVSVETVETQHAQATYSPHSREEPRAMDSPLHFWVKRLGGCISELYIGPQTHRAVCLSHYLYVTRRLPYATFERRLNICENNLVLRIKISKF